MGDLEVPIDDLRAAGASLHLVAAPSILSGAVLDLYQFDRNLTGWSLCT
jgi:hypothetical protein